MKLEHIALTVSNPSEIEKFYKRILGMKEVKNFVLKENLAGRIFSFENETQVFLLQNDNLFFEIFVLPKPLEKGFNHICISVTNREGLVNKAMQNNYEVIRIEREYNDLIFIKDNSGNIFEIKERID
ncbi:MAG: VOC family protein [Bacteroidales bacterium]|nr:VOC family protein [Bacteroidales bacterium]